MTHFLINVLMALAWAAVTGSFSELNLAFGFVLAALALSLIREQVGSVGYFERARRIGSLGLLFLYELALSSIKVALLVLKPNMVVRPGIFTYPLKVERDGEITLLANLITLTPGTLSVDVSDDRQHLFIHTLDCSDPDQLRRDIAYGFERKIMETTR